MTDVLTPGQRSYCMSMIKGTNTKPEILLRKALWRNGFRYRLNYKLSGNPDLTFPARRIAVFVDGCFWHGCPRHMTKPKKNSSFWETKLRKNMERDKEVNRILAGMGWNVVRIWEHEIKADIDSVVQKLICILQENT